MYQGTPGSRTARSRPIPLPPPGIAPSIRRGPRRMTLGLPGRAICWRQPRTQAPVNRHHARTFQPRAMRATTVVRARPACAPAGRAFACVGLQRAEQLAVNLVREVFMAGAQKAGLVVSMQAFDGSGGCWLLRRFAHYTLTEPLPTMAAPRSTPCAAIALPGDFTRPPALAPPPPTWLSAILGAGPHQLCHCQLLGRPVATT